MISPGRARRARLAVAITIAIAAAPTAAFAQSSGEAQIKGAFVYNFLKFVEWPAPAFRSSADSLVVAVIGRGATSDATAAFLAGKSVNARPIAVRRLADAGAEGIAPTMHAMFVSGSDPGIVRQAIESLAGREVLTIGESDGFVEAGGAIGLVVEDKRVRFDINADAALAAHLRVSSKLLALARNVLGLKLGALR